MYEVEYKVEITKEERDRLKELFETEGFLKKPEVFQKNYYVGVQDSPHGGHDLKRYRDEGEVIIYSDKVWEKFDSKKIRKEIEHEVSREELELVLKQHFKRKDSPCVVID